MSELREMYQELILDHSRKPRNFHVIERANRKANGANPLCGDLITVFVELDGDVIHDIGFQGSGCAISRASASLMTGSLKGKTIGESRALFEQFHRLVTSEVDAARDTAELGKLTVFAGVRQFPARVKCASLAWHTMRAAVEAQGKTVSTEGP